jgi:hypothetical protein
VHPRQGPAYASCTEEAHNYTLSVETPNGSYHILAPSWSCLYSANLTAPNRKRMKARSRSVRMLFPCKQHAERGSERRSEQMPRVESACTKKTKIRTRHNSTQTCIHKSIQTHTHTHTHTHIHAQLDSTSHTRHAAAPHSETATSGAEDDEAYMRGGDVSTAFDSHNAVAFRGEILARAKSAVQIRLFVLESVATREFTCATVRVACTVIDDCLARYACIVMCVYVWRCACMYRYVHVCMAMCMHIWRCAYRNCAQGDEDTIGH